MPPGALVGPARVIAIRDPKAIRVRELAPRRIRRGERVLFKTRNSSRCWGAKAFCADYVYLARDAAAFLVDRGVSVIGIDYLSIGPPNPEGVDVHQLLLGAGVWIIEGLDLAAARPGSYDLACLPLSIPEGDGAPARAILRARR
jgi:arylformamidase